MNFKLKLSAFREVRNVYAMGLKHGLIHSPKAIVEKLILDSIRHRDLSTEKAKGVLGSNFLRFVNDLGPVYGKALQIYLTTVDFEKSSLKGFDLEKVYGDWPPLEFGEIESILDDEIPLWRETLKIDKKPLGVASMAQVHACTDKDGNSLIIKVLKPHSVKRLIETVEALESMLRVSENYLRGAGSQKVVRDLKELCRGLRLEISLTHELATIEKVRGQLDEKRAGLISVPEVIQELSSDRVITMERFQGKLLSEIVKNKEIISEKRRRHLAKSLVSELLVQVFELGLFHGDPHAGNLMLLEDGSIGLFDWGLSGELEETDRKHIAAILRSLMGLDFDALVDALYELGLESGSSAEKEMIAEAMKNFASRVSEARERGKRPSVASLVSECMEIASHLKIDVPDGLLMMAKSLITIEALARGIDPHVPLARVAMPVLFKAARPRVRDYVRLIANVPKLSKKIFNK